MSITKKNDAAARLRRLPGQFLLALLNATAILIIVAAVLALTAVSRVEQAAGLVTDAILAEVDVNPQQALDELRALSAEVEGLRTAIAEFEPGGGALLEPARERLEDRLDDLQAQLDGLAEARHAIVQDGMASIAEGFAELAEGLAGCRLSPRGQSGV